jgi:hypothetical protein
MAPLPKQVRPRRSHSVMARFVTLLAISPSVPTGRQTTDCRVASRA